MLQDSKPIAEVLGSKHKVWINERRSSDSLENVFDCYFQILLVSSSLAEVVKLATNVVQDNPTVRLKK